MESYKFKLSCEVSADFDFIAPAASYSMKGYFIMKDEAAEGGKAKVPEEGVVLNFAPIPGKEGKRWTVTGSGANQFGAFKLTGEVSLGQSFLCAPLFSSLLFSCSLIRARTKQPNTAEFHRVAAKPIYSMAYVVLLSAKIDVKGDVAPARILTGISCDMLVAKDLDLLHI